MPPTAEGEIRPTTKGTGRASRTPGRGPYGTPAATRLWGERLSVGAEGLYGLKEIKDGSDGNVLRSRPGLVYSIVD